MSEQIANNLPFDKKPVEAYPIGFQFYGRLPPGAKIESVVASARNITDNVNDNTVLQSTAGVVKQQTLAVVGVQGGTVGKKYRITCQVFLTSGDNDNLIETRDMTIVA